MKMSVLTAILFATVASTAYAVEECPPDTLLFPALLEEVHCFRIELPATVVATEVKTVVINVDNVANMSALPQDDVLIREVAEVVE